jgi:hypothetical protein
VCQLQRIESTGLRRQRWREVGAEDHLLPARGAITWPDTALICCDAAPLGRPRKTQIRTAAAGIAAPALRVPSRLGQSVTAMIDEGL